MEWCSNLVTHIVNALLSGIKDQKHASAVFDRPGMGIEYYPEFENLHIKTHEGKTTIILYTNRNDLASVIRRYFMNHITHQTKSCTITTNTRTYSVRKGN